MVVQLNGIQKVYQIFLKRQGLKPAHGFSGSRELIDPEISQDGYRSHASMAQGHQKASDRVTSRHSAGRSGRARKDCCFHFQHLIHSLAFCLAKIISCANEPDKPVEKNVKDRAVLQVFRGAPERFPK
jgi:hypothetical protein